MKYIIEIEEEPFESPGSEQRLWKSTEFNSLVFDKTGLEKLTPYDESAAEQRGQEEAWELACVIGKRINKGGLSDLEIEDIFGVNSHHAVFEMTYSEARERYEAWKKQKNDKQNREKVIALANDIGIHCLYALVCDIRGEQ